MKQFIEEGTREYRCDTCIKFIPNTSARVCGWCADDGLPPRDIFLLLQGEGAVAYNTICEEWQGVSESAALPGMPTLGYEGIGAHG